MISLDDLAKHVTVSMSLDWTDKATGNKVNLINWTGGTPGWLLAILAALSVGGTHWLDLLTKFVNG